MKRLRLVAVISMFAVATITAISFYWREPLMARLKSWYRPGTVVLVAESVKNLPGWQHDDLAGVAQALQRSCYYLERRSPLTKVMAKYPEAGIYAEWQTICKRAQQLPGQDKNVLKNFIERHFKAYRVYYRGCGKGLFTGYYLPLLHCSLIESKRFNVPIHGRPDDLIHFDLGFLDETQRGKKVTGQLTKNKIIRYPVRREIRKMRSAQIPVIAWCDDELAVALAQIQGSAIVELENGERFLIGYHATNGRTHTMIGKILREINALAPQNISLATIKNWLRQHPELLKPILEQNESYVFFRKLSGTAPVGAQQAELTPERSLAVDRRYVPLGALVWIDTKLPKNAPEGKRAYRRLLVAQDVGGAIKGGIRGDIYFGSGEEAERLAGGMKQSGRYWLLFPRPFRELQ